MVVFFDFDGTIVDQETQIIPPSTADAIHALRVNGHLPVLNTGRPSGHVDPRALALDFAGMVCSCGMEVFLEGKTLLQVQPSPQVCRKVRRLTRECGMQVLYEAADRLLLDGQYSTCRPCLEEIAMMRGKGVPPIVECDDVADPLFIKLVSHDAPGCDKERYLREMAEDFEVIIRGETFVEYVGKGYSKATGMDLLLKHLGLTRQDSFAIGDSPNDLTMFAAAGTTIAMGGCSDELRPHASYVTDTVLGDGIAKALKHYGLI